MKQTIAMLALMTLGSSAMAETISFACSNSTQGIAVRAYQTTVKENQALNQFTVSIVQQGMFGARTLEFKGDDLEMTITHNQELASNTSYTETICGKKMKTTSTVYTVKATFSKKDGTAIYQDDTEESSPKQISENLICSSSLTSNWPCN